MKQTTLKGSGHESCYTIHPSHDTKYSCFYVIIKLSYSFIPAFTWWTPYPFLPIQPTNRNPSRRINFFSPLPWFKNTMSSQLSNIYGFVTESFNHAFPWRTKIRNTSSFAWHLTPATCTPASRLVNVIT